MGERALGRPGDKSSLVLVGTGAHEVRHLPLDFLMGKLGGPGRLNSLSQEQNQNPGLLRVCNLPEKETETVSCTVRRWDGRACGKVALEPPGRPLDMRVRDSFRSSTESACRQRPEGLPKPSRCTFPKFEHQNSQDLGGGWWNGRPGLLDRPAGLPEKISLWVSFTLVTDGTHYSLSR